MAKVLILDQSKSIRNTLRERLEFEGIAAESAENEAAASVLCERIPFDLIISDHETRLPESDVPFIVLSSEATVDSAIKALRNGAQDYLTKPIDINRLMQSIRQTLEQAAEAPRTAAKAKAKRSSAGHTEEIIGTSEQMQHVRRLIDKVAPCDARVLITGENGTGKELVARWLHAKSNRAGAPFVEVNCAAIPSELIESELFGHERGAFTSAVKQRKGKFEQADGGTLFMDEIGDMSLAAQAKVLRALQESRISRVGSDRDIEVNVRVVAATNKNLREEIQKGNFREDLYYRLNTVPIAVPALRDRREDIFLLFRKFAADVAVQYRMPAVTLDDAAREMLKNYYWRGNIRQLKNVAEQISAIEQTRVITSEVLAKYLPPQGGGAPMAAGTMRMDDTMSTERELLYKVLFDMRADINDLKRMISELMKGGVPCPEPVRDVKALLPTTAQSSYVPAVASYPQPPVYAESEEVTDEPPREMTKADMQREQIIRALRRNNGRRREAAAELFMSERTLYRKIKELGIEDNS